MRGILGLLCFLSITQGIGGLVHHLTDGRIHLWALTRKADFLEGYHVAVEIALICVGLALGAASEAVKRHEESA
ncbi:hypothetical protein [Spirillospora albida]|uniref:hypothetical protein n=1 Tax=Spirillospora albida TaxID=58123 RepID=UPI0004C10801|nr:hypothetical protein [Spirillospora albida]